MPADSASPARSHLFAVVGAVAAVFWVALAAWGLSSPTGSSPDDDYHLAHIYCAGGAAACTPAGERLYPCFAWNPVVTGDCLPSEAVRAVAGAPNQSREPLGPAKLPTTTGISDDRPTLYPRVAAFFTGDTLAQTSAAVRLVNAALAVLLAVGSIAVSTPRLRGPVTLGWLVASVPLGTFLVASTNPSSWSIIGIAAFWGPTLSFLTDRGSRTLSVARVAFAQVAVAMAIGSRNDSPLYIGIALIALMALVLPLPSRDMRRRLLLPAVLAAECLAVFIGVTSGRAQYVATGLPAPDASNGWSATLLRAVSTPLQALTAPSLGWLDTPMPAPVTALVTGVFAATVLIGVGVMGRRKALALILLLGLSGALIIVVSSRTAAAQPRYYLPLLMVLAGWALLPVHGRRSAMPDRLQLALLLAALTVANSLALSANLQRYLTGSGGTAGDPVSLAGVTAGWWWHGVPLSPLGVWLSGSVAFAAGSAGVWWLLPRVTRSQSTVPTVVDLRRAAEVSPR